MAPVVDSESQRRFVELSGDANPLHVDPLQARRTQYEVPVVHGVHLALLAIDRVLEEAVVPQALQAFAARFRSGIVVGEQFELNALRSDDDKWVVSLDSGATRRAEVTFTLAARDDASPEVKPGEPKDFGADVQEWTDLDRLSSRTGNSELAVDRDLLAECVSNVARYLPAGDAAALLAMTRVVGMECPGQWALLRSLAFERREGGPEEPVAEWCVERTRPGMRLVELRFEGPGWQGTAQVVLREAPPSQISLGDARALIEDAEFGGIRALIVGGSRGLGEATTRLLLAGGATCLVTYRLGRDDAERVIAGAEPGRAHTLQLEIGNPSGSVVEELRKFDPTHAMLFATPAIPRRVGMAWDQTVFERYARIYVGGFEWLVETLAGASLRAVLYPSSAFVDERPAGFDEYCAAKAAGEHVARTIDVRAERPAVHVERFPVLSTDQTVGSDAADAMDNAHVLLSALRRCVLR